MLPLLASPLYPALNQLSPPPACGSWTSLYWLRVSCRNGACGWARFRCGWFLEPGAQLRAEN